MDAPLAPPAPVPPADAPATLLFVDDEPSILSALRRLFRPHGYRVLLADSGAAALEMLAQEKVDLVLSDMRMPGMDGAQLLQAVRERWPDVARLLLTGYADIGSTIAAINHGEIQRYIAKPWDDNEVLMPFAMRWSATACAWRTSGCSRSPVSTTNSWSAAWPPARPSCRR